MISSSIQTNSGDPEIEFNSPLSHKRKHQLVNELSLQHFLSILANADPLELPGIRWKTFKQLFSDQSLQINLDSGPLTLTIEKGPWSSWVCREEDQLWPEKVPTGQTYEYIHAHADDKTYFKIRRGLKGRVGEFMKVSKGTLLSGTEGIDLCMRILNYFNFESLMLNDDAYIEGKNSEGKDSPLEMRVFLTVVSPEIRTLYTDVGFILWENNPTIAYDGSVFNSQSRIRYEEAVTYLRNTKLTQLSLIEMASRKQMRQLSQLCDRYHLDFQQATVHSLGAAIFNALKIPATKVEASQDFRTFYEVCLWASDSPKAGIYNAALDILDQYKFWIKTRQATLQEAVRHMLRR